MYQQLLSHISAVFAAFFFIIGGISYFYNIKLKENNSRWHIGMSIFIGLYTAVLCINTFVQNEHWSISLYFTHWMFSYAALYCYLNAIEYYLKKKIPLLKIPKLVFLIIPAIYILSALVFQFTGKSPFIVPIPDGLMTNYSKYSYLTVMGSTKGMLVGYIGISFIVFSSLVIWRELSNSRRNEYMLKAGIILCLITGAYDTAIGLGNLQEQLPIFYLGFGLEALRFMHYTKKQEKKLVLGLNSEVDRLSKVAQLGIVTASISHDIQNHLSIIKNSLSILEASSDKKILEIAKDHTQELTEISQMYTGLFKKNLEKTVQMIDVKQIIKSATELSARKLAKANVNLTICEYENFSIEGNRTELSLCLVNLINNSLDAIKDLDQPWIKIIVSKKYQTIEVIDSGDGIPAENVEKLFEYDFSTKKQEGGTGLGLAIVRQILKKQGYILSYNHHSKNTSFIINFLPQ